MDITSIFTGIIMIITGVLSYFVIPLLKTKLNAEQMATLTATVRAGVYAAEQLYKASGKGKEKFQYVLDFLKEKGYTIDENELNSEIKNLIEATVKELSIQKTAAETAPAVTIVPNVEVPANEGNGENQE